MTYEAEVDTKLSRFTALLEPLMLVMLVAVGVTLLAIITWMLNKLPLEAAVGVMVALPVVAILAVVELRKRKSRSQA